MVCLGHRILPDQLLLGNIRAKIPGLGPHIAMGKLEPRPGKGIGKRLRVRKKIPGNGFVNRIKPQGEVSGGHHGAMLFGWIMGIYHHIFILNILCQPLVGTGRTFDQFPFVFKQHLEISHVPLGRIGLPGAFDTAADGVAAFAPTVAAFPSQPHLFEGGRLGFRSQQRRIAGAMAFAECVAPGHQGHGLFVVHGHPGKGFPHINPGGNRIRIAVRPFRIYIN